MVTFGYISSCSSLNFFNLVNLGPNMGIPYSRGFLGIKYREDNNILLIYYIIFNYLGVVPLLEKDSSKNKLCVILKFECLTVLEGWYVVNEKAEFVSVVRSSDQTKYVHLCSSACCCTRERSPSKHPASPLYDGWKGALLKCTMSLKGHCIEFKYYADGIHSGLTPPG